MPAPATLSSPVAGDAVADAVHAAELPDVDMDQFAEMGALAAPDRFGWGEIAHLA